MLEGSGIHGVTPIPSGYNPATCLLEVTTPAAEGGIGQDFVEIYQNSHQFREVEASIERMSIPPPNLEPLKFDFTYSRSALTQFRYSLWKQFLVYWRSPSYNVVRLFFTALNAFILGTAFRGVGSK
ncbi:hypothetical protein U1Q18_022884, partial [Sarracenia purpurea var. burkii]